MKTKLSEYVMVAEAAAILGVSQGTIRTWAEAGEIPMHKMCDALHTCNTKTQSVMRRSSDSTRVNQ